VTGAEWGVLLGAIILIGAVNWWFFAAGRGVTAPTGGSDEQRHH
jgi:hypothetical protein